MGLKNRAVEACRRDWSCGIVDESNVRDVLRCDTGNIGCLECFIGAGYTSEVRIASARVIAVHGKIEQVAEVALVEKDKTILFEFLCILGENGNGIEVLRGLLDSSDTIIRDAAIDMFRRAGKSEQLLHLIFERDGNMVKRIKRYINESGKNR
jgi:hypothetical protein